MTVFGLSRRTALGGLVVGTGAVLTGCTAASGVRHKSPSPSPAPEDPDVTLAAAVLGQEQAMLDQVVATARRHPRLTGAVAGARAAHRAHVALLTRAVPTGGAARGAAPRRVLHVPKAPGAALAALAHAEDRLAGTGRDHALAARSGAFARVLASMAAAAAQQSTHLGALARIHP